VLGDNPPPQQLFELGGNMLLPGYRYKQFAGDHAALFRTFVGYRFGVWQKPIVLFRGIYIPGLSPGLVASAQGGWTEVSSPGAAQSVRQLGVDANGVPLSAATNGVRATAGGGVSFSRTCCTWEWRGRSITRRIGAWSSASERCFER
jgi:hypothetical protein